jgi:cytoplasmic iron level regulating protein YaaA (DUF328/UPF0246 family)
MLVLLSPAKSLDFDPPAAGLPATAPLLGDDTALLAERARALTPADLRRLMGISEALADLNHARFQAFGTARATPAKQAALAFSGDTYTGLDAATLTAEDLAWAQDHLRILSGLYGALRPLDRIEPYRLEMGTRLDTGRGKDLYAFWKGRLGPLLDAAVAGHRHPVIVNCASAEYVKAAETKTLTARVITPVFQEERHGKARVIGLMAKRARGMMARHVIVNRLEDPAGLTAFAEGGYRYCPDASNEDVWVFRRPQP